jgi:hypothetical protein
LVSEESGSRGYANIEITVRVYFGVVEDLLEGPEVREIEPAA